MRRLVSGIVLAVIVAASLGCGGGLSEKEVREIVDETTAARQAEFRAEIEGVLLVRQQEEADFLKDLESLFEENKEAIQSDMANALQQHVYSTCASDSKIVALSVALGTMHDYLAGGESTLEEVEQVLTEGLPIYDGDFYGQYSRVCGITTEGNWYLQPIATQ